MTPSQFEWKMTRLETKIKPILVDLNTNQPGIEPNHLLAMSNVWLWWELNEGCEDDIMKQCIIDLYEPLQ